MKRKWIRVLIPLAAVFSMVLALSFPGRAAEVVDLEKKCSLTVTPGVFLGDGSEYLTDQLNTAAMVIDLYKVAEALPNTANGLVYDGYVYELEELYKDGGFTISEKMTDADWRAQAQNAARIALGITVDPQTGSVSGNVAEVPVVTGAAAGEKIEDLDAGLYLLIARRGGVEDPEIEYGDVADYVVARNDNGTEKIVTIANSHDCVFTFEPELISLPGKDPYVDASGNLVGSHTANPGPWRYDMTSVLKPAADNRYGNLQIVKVLPEFGETAGEPRPVTFVFEVRAVWEDKLGGRQEQREYKDVVAIDFTSAGSRNAYKLNEELKLPVGAEVTVKEIYSGPGYQPYPEGASEEAIRTAFEKTVVITEAETTFEVTFTNYYNGRHIDGHGITNNFTYSGEQERWIWTSIHADGTVGGDPSVSGGNTDLSGGTP